MSLILKSNERAPRGSGKDVFNLDSKFGEYEILLDFSTQNYLLRNNDGDLDRLSFADAVTFSRTGRTEYYDRFDGWQIAASGEPAFHYDKNSGALGLLHEPSTSVPEQKFNRRGGDVLSSETVTMSYTGAYVWLTVRGTGSVTVSGDIEARNVTLTASEGAPASLKLLNSGDNTSTVTFTATGSVDAMMLYAGQPYGGASFTPYVSKTALEAKGATSITLTTALVAKLNSLTDYTVMIDSTTHGGYPKYGDVMRIGSTTTGEHNLASMSSGAIRVQTKSPTAAIETYGTFIYVRRLYNDPVPTSVKNKGEVITATNGLDIKFSQTPITITDALIGFGEKNRVITRLVVYPRAFSKEELRELALAWSRSK